MFSITLIHPSGERKSVPVEYVAPSLTYLTIRWDLAGIYDLNLTVNILTPRSATPQAKGKAKWYKKDKPQWKAEDIVAVRKMASDYLNEKRGNPKVETEAAVKRHAESMPNWQTFDDGGVPATNPRIGELEQFERNANRAENWRKAGAPAGEIDERYDSVVPFPHYEGDPDIEDEIG